MRYGSVLQRRLVRLESTIKIPTLDEQTAAIEAEALSKLSFEDLCVLRDIAVRQAAGIAIDDTPLNREVSERFSAARALVQIPQPAQRNTC